MTINNKIADIGYGPVVGSTGSIAATTLATAGNLTRIVDGDDESHRFQITISSVGANTSSFIVKYSGGQATRKGGEQVLSTATGMHVINIEPEYLAPGEILKVKLVGIDSSGRPRNTSINQLLEPDMFPAYSVDIIPPSNEQVVNALYCLRI